MSRGTSFAPSTDARVPHLLPGDARVGARPLQPRDARGARRRRASATRASASACASSAARRGEPGHEFAPQLREVSDAAVATAGRTRSLKRDGVERAGVGQRALADDARAPPLRRSARRRARLVTAPSRPRPRPRFARTDSRAVRARRRPASRGAIARVRRGIRAQRRERRRRPRFRGDAVGGGGRRRRDAASRTSTAAVLVPGAARRHEPVEGCGTCPRLEVPGKSLLLQQEMAEWRRVRIPLARAREGGAFASRRAKRAEASAIMELARVRAASRSRHGEDAEAPDRDLARRGLSRHTRSSSAFGAARAGDYLRARSGPPAAEARADEHAPRAAPGGAARPRAPRAAASRAGSGTARCALSRAPAAKSRHAAVRGALAARRRRRSACAARSERL